ncbi:uncharacterized protein LOC109855435 [Pseudomyrmex gracilis]|uniref:uncharacterized protein LOC109855435 n=1 Tax=Pseudomyrmex gracilis TaxID=219809 RepID=UPI0009950F87|nr:uncharacterized protein LOC109855435 [Pseudomyrmex gracilis]
MSKKLSVRERELSSSFFAVRIYMQTRHGNIKLVETVAKRFICARNKKQDIRRAISALGIFMNDVAVAVLFSHLFTAQFAGRGQKACFTKQQIRESREESRKPTVLPSSQTVTANEGESLDIVVEFCTVPKYTKVLWMSEERVYTPDTPPRDGVRALAIEDGGTESCYRTTLRFEMIQWSHAGEWLLLVRSPEGIADASVLLNVTRASEYSRGHVRSASITYLLLCLILQAILQERRR